MSKIETVFIIDDDSAFQFLAEVIFEDTQLVSNVFIFPHGLEALEHIKSGVQNKKVLPDLILLDLNMPIMDGWQFLDEFLQFKSKLKKKITIYILSSSINPADIERAKSISEVSEFIIKPISEKKIMEIIQNSQ